MPAVWRKNGMCCESVIAKEYELNLRDVLEKIRQAGRTSLTESESKQVLKAYGIPVTSETVAADRDEALKAAQDIGFPVVMKGLGATLLHKTERGLVHLNLGSSGDTSLNLFP